MFFFLHGSAIIRGCARAQDKREEKKKRYRGTHTKRETKCNKEKKMEQTWCPARIPPYPPIFSDFWSGRRVGSHHNPIQSNPNPIEFGVAPPTHKNKQNIIEKNRKCKRTYPLAHHIIFFSTSGSGLQRPLGSPPTNQSRSKRPK